MARFWPTMGIGFLFASFVGLIGYGFVMSVRGTIVDPTGQWFGPWPLSGAKDCRTKLFPSGRFEMECRADETYAGLGQWKHDVTQITFRFEQFVRGGEQVVPTPTYDFRIRGKGNEIQLGLPNDEGEPYRWRRAKL